MAVYESSLVGDEKPDERDAGVKRILDVMVDPAVEMCSAASEEKQRLRPRWDQHVFVLNCLTHLQASPKKEIPLSLTRLITQFGRQNALEAFSFTAQKQQNIQTVIEERVKVLTEELVSVHISIPSITSVKMSWTSSTTTF